MSKNETDERNDLKDEDLIWHYCSVETFFKIIESQTFWFSNTDYMEDEFDSSWFNEKLKQRLDIHKNDLDPKIYKTFMNAGQMTAYTCCFSTKNNILSQWEKYADNGRGLAIGIDKNNINNKLEKFKLIYNEQEQNNVIDKFITSNLVGKSYDTGFPEEDVHNILLQKLSLSKKLKKPSYESENEFRLLYSGENAQKKYYIKNNNIVDYYDLIFKDIIADNPSQFIKKICIGPNCKLNELQIRDFIATASKNNKLDASNNKLYELDADYISFEKKQLLIY